jgi:pyruvate dehydrogenase E2 component (dihydrolipoamide acetyltransferase)
MLERIHADLGRRRLTGLAEALLGGSGQAVSIRADLARLAERIPVRLILGGRDRILDWRDALDVSPRIAIHHLPRAGHSPHWEALPDVAAIITDITS